MKREEAVPASMPTGEVTLLFTDVVGSSRLWEQHGDGFIPIWQAHDAVLRDAFTRFGGYEVKTEGDAFMVAFREPASAVHCALFAQAALARYPWPTDIGPLRVRMGIHTGEPIVHGSDYFGPVVNRAANTCKAAHGGQILVTEETIREAGQGIDAKVDLCDLGDHRLKDMGLPQKLFEARHSELQMRSFPPPRTLEGQPNNLPVQRTSFVGRAKEIEQIAAYLAQGNKPLLTVVGPSGIGKTRLTLQAAAAHADWFPDGVWYVRLDRAGDLTGAATAIAESMNIPINPAGSAVEQVRTWLSNRQCLLILDDANALPHADRLLREILSGTSGLRCLATARESLQIDDADDLHLAGLSTEVDTSRTGVGTLRDGAEAVVTEHDSFARTEAGRLFVDRAADANPDFKMSPPESAAAAKLIAWLEGVPDSIERAAQLMHSFAPSAVLDELEKRLAPVLDSPGSPGVEKLKGIMRKGAQKVRHSVGEATRPPTVNLNKLIQGIANVATDRKEDLQAALLGRESLKLSQDAGDDLGVADALRQLARVKAQQGDHASARAMLAAAAQLYRRHNSAVYAEVSHELKLEESTDHTDHEAVAHVVSNAVNLALGTKENS